MVLLTLRPRLVVYNIFIDELRLVLADLVERLDPDGRWAGDSLVLPGLGVQVYLDSTGLDAQCRALIRLARNRTTPAGPSWKRRWPPC